MAENRIKRLHWKSAFVVGVICFASIAETRAAPIEYRFSWQGSATLTQSLPDVTAQMVVAGHPSDVVTAANVAFNGPATMTGNFNAAGLSGQFPVQVTRENTHQMTLLTLQPANLAYDLNVFGTGFPGVATYDLRSAFGPVNGPGGFGGALSYDFGAAGVLTFSSISSASFNATTSSADDISYDFSWHGAATLAKTINAQFSMIVQGDTDDVFTGANFAFNGPATMTGNLNGAGLNGQFPVQVSRDTDNQITLLSLQPPDHTYELAVIGTGFPGVDTYDLRSAFGPVGGSGGFTGPLSFDFGPDGVLTFSGINSPSFEAVEIQPVPEPGTAGLIVSAALLGFPLTRKSRR